jgi:asparagine synthase (glutamine-hydrolysing)
MCGILGGWSAQPIPREGIDEALKRLAHRGPDDSGLFSSAPAFLGSRRLSIIDLEGGHQPIANEDGSVVVVLNGEIYNYVELMADLKTRGHTFRTASDTETLVHLYEERGEELVKALRGMFAFAIWDGPRKRLFLARDRFGKKPLFYSRLRDGGLLFASELKALRPLALAASENWQIRDQGIYDYLSLGVVPQPETIYEGVHALMPGHWLTFDGHQLQQNRYWRLQYEPKANIPYDEVLERTRTLIEEAVRLRLRSDVPLGVFLSGGVDSTVVAYEAARVVGKSLQTFTVAMEQKEFDEPPGHSESNTPYCRSK